MMEILGLFIFSILTGILVTVFRHWPSETVLLLICGLWTFAAIWFYDRVRRNFP